MGSGPSTNDAMETYPFPKLNISFATEYTTKQIKLKFQDNNITLPKGNFSIEYQVGSIDDIVDLEFFNFDHDDETQKVVVNIIHENEIKDITSICTFEIKDNLDVAKNVVKKSYNSIFSNGTLKIAFFKKWFECNILGGAQILDQPNLPVQWVMDYEPNSLRVDNNKKVFDVVCLGCSFTYGFGLDYTETWPHILGQQTKLDVANLGTTGAGIDSILRQFFYVKKNITTKQIYVLLPGFYRKRVKFKFGDKICEYLHVLGSRSIDFLSKNYLKKIDKEIIDHGKNRGTKLIKFFEMQNNVKLTSWDEDVYQTLDATKRLPKYILNEDEITNERATDGEHPHMKHNEYFVKSLNLTYVL